jgi:hypothetical protein
MSLLSMLSAPRHVTLRVTSESGPATFDVLVVFDRGGLATQRFSEEQTPFETELADGDVTIVVRPRDATHPVVAEYEVAVGGKRRLWVRSWDELPVLRRYRGGVIGAGFSGRHSPGRDEPPIGAPAI